MGLEDAREEGGTVLVAHIQVEYLHPAQKNYYFRLTLLGWSKYFEFSRVCAVAHFSPRNPHLSSPLPLRNSI